MKRSPSVVMVVLLSLATSSSLGCRHDVCREGAPAPIAQALPRPSGAGAHVFAHAHNDYEHERPLLDALDARFYSVEADVYLNDGAIRVSHDGFSFAGTLDELYLDPLQARVADAGSVYGDDVPFTLWIDLKDGSQQLQDALATDLARYDMLTQFAANDDDGDVDARAVTVLLTGDAGAKRALVDRAGPRPYARDDNDFTLDDQAADSRWTSYALSWGSYVSWDGNGTIADDERARLVCIVDGAHERHRTVRMFATPETTGYWQLALDVGVDFINTDDLAGLSAFLDSH